ncbi:hypothetical protein JT93_000660 [Salmonella enterica]|nr:hypothetical protein [Salmonella enterica]
MYSFTFYCIGFFSTMNLFYKLLSFFCILYFSEVIVLNNHEPLLMSLYR